MNKGSGPAILRSVRVVFNGKEVSGWGELMTTCCGFPKAPSSADFTVLHMTSSPLAGSVLAPGERLHFVSLRRTLPNGAYWDALNLARHQLRVEACYCSPLGECWTSNISGGEPDPVRACRGPRGYVE